MAQSSGADYFGNGLCEFVVWAPILDEVFLHILPGSPGRIIPLVKDEDGFFSVDLNDIPAGTRYFYRIKDGLSRLTIDLPDPASHYQPEGIFGPSCVIDHSSFRWGDNDWQGLPLDKMIIYELHVGTFTPEGTFEAIIGKLDYLCELGINAIEIMPAAEFPGERGWGYDGVFPFAVQHSYGGPKGLKELVDNCHRRGIAVVLDVVYNHLGPEGNNLARFMPVFTDKYLTPWGNAINFDAAYSWGVRDFFIQNALFWLENYHIDALRLDAVHGIYDMSAKHFLRELSENVKKFSIKKKRKFYLMAESDLNDIRIIDNPEKGGYGIDAQWNDDFHHALHALLTGEDQGYYKDFGEISHLVKALKNGFVYDWKYSKFRKRYHGSPSGDISPWQLIVSSQNHDQIGNRAHGERLSTLVPFEALKLAACAVILSSYVPILFMGEEYAEEAPFLYFMSFYDKNLIDAVRESRKKEFSSFTRDGGSPDPYDTKTFLDSKLRWENSFGGRQQALFRFYKKLIQLRKEIPALECTDKNNMNIETLVEKKLIILRRANKNSEICSCINFSDQPVSFKLEIPYGKWVKILDSQDKEWNGKGSNLPGEISSFRELTATSFACAVWEKK